MRMRYSAVPWVRYVADKEIRDFITNHGKIRTYKKGECVIPPSYMYPHLSLLVSGMLSKSFDVQSSKGFAMSIILPGSTLGDFFFMSKRTCNLKIMAIRETSLIECPHEVVEREMFASLPFYRNVMNHLMLDMESDSEGLATITARATDERLRILLKIFLVRYNVVPKGDWYELPIYLSHAEMSRIIYTTPLTVNRLLLKYKKDGLYDYKSQRSRFVNAQLFTSVHDWNDDDPVIQLNNG